MVSPYDGQLFQHTGVQNFAAITIHSAPVDIIMHSWEYTLKDQASYSGIHIQTQIINT